MMKILIIENEYYYISAPFDYINKLYFKGSIEYTVVEKSQDIKPFSILSSYDYIFLDISLSHQSKLDGFGILNQILKDEIKIKKLVIMTGNHLIEEKLNEKGLPNYQVLSKPIDFNDLLQIIKN